MSSKLTNILISLGFIVLLASACQAGPAVGQSLPTATVATSPTPLPLPASVPTPTLAPSREPLWTFSTQGVVWSSPTVLDGTVYIGSDDGNLYAIEAQTGSLKWQFLTQGIVRSQPAIAGGLVYFASDDGYLYAVEAQAGAQAWRTDIGNSMPSDGRRLGGDPSPTGWDYKQSSPIVADGQIYVGSLDGSVYALAAGTGAINWTFKTGQKVRATPTLADGVLYIGSWDESMYALDVLTGQMLWTTPVGGEVQSTALVADGLVYTASRKASVVALDAQTGEIKWEYPYGGNNWVESSPRLVGNVIYIGSSARAMVVGLDSQTGEKLTAYQSYVCFWSTPAVEGNMLYIGGTAPSYFPLVPGGLFGLEIPSDVTVANPMKLKWLLPLVDTLLPIQDWAGVASSPVVQNGMVYFGALDGKLYAVSTAT